MTLSPASGAPELELELREGASLAELRPHLARLGVPAAAPVLVGGTVLDESHRVGLVPLVAGAHLEVGDGEPDGTLAAARAAWHLAVLDGPAAGTVWPVSGRTRVGREGPGLRLRDPLVSAEHLELRLAGARPWVRDLGSRNGTVRSRRWSRHRLRTPVPRWWTPARHGERLRLGTTTVELRSASPRTRARTSHRRALLLALLPALASLGLVLGTGRPALLLGALLGPALAAVLWHREEGAEPEERLEVDASALLVATARAVLAGRRPEPDGLLARLAPTGVLAVLGPQALETAWTLALAGQARGVEPAGWSRWLGGEGPEVVLAAHVPERAPAGRLLILVDPPHVPSWCPAVLERGTWHGPDGARRVEVRPGGAAWAERQARLLAAARALAETGAGDPPRSVRLGELGLPRTVEEVRAAWSAATDGLPVVLGAGPGGRPVVVDLVREGPHLLVAGTTGSGKSEALRAIVASLALRLPPTALGLALVDFKGGAGFGDLARLPHVVGAVTDLDPVEAGRCLEGLAAELRRRKALLAAAGASDLRELAPGPEHPGRLLVVVDEFRALAEELPELMPALVRLATQGRSLGVHLVLATQRPQGVVTPELRANVAVRLALRVTDAADSLDVVETPRAAEIPPSLPGRGVLRRGPAGTEEVQVALLGPAPAPLRPAGDPPPQEDPDAALLAVVGEAAEHWPGARPRAPWLPALPGRVPASALEPAGGLAYGLADVPAEQRRETAAWDPGEGHLLVLGGPRSGRSTALATVAAAALASGWEVHAVDLPEELRPAGLATCLPAAEPLALGRLLGLLAESEGPALLVLDDLEAVRRSLDGLARGAGTERLAALWRSRRVAVAAAAQRPGGAWSEQLAERLVLPLADPVAEELAGVPRALSGGRRPPGRAVRLPARGEPRLVQVALPGPTDRRPLPPRLVPLPERAVRPARLGPSRRGLAVGVGGDRAEVLSLPLGGALVVGPPGSGRSTALAHLVRSLPPGPCLTLARDPQVLEAGARLGPVRTDPGEASGLAGAGTVVVDDLDLLLRLSLDLEAELETLLDSGGTLLASTGLDAAVSTYRGPLARLRARRTGVVLQPGRPGASEVFGSPLEWFADPVRPLHPGRGALQSGSRVEVLQVFAPEG